VSSFNDLSIARFLTNELSRIPARPSSSLLDLGCGTRPYLPLYERRFPFHIAADYGVRGPIDLRLDAARLPFQDGSFDVVLLSEVIEHVPDPGLVLAEIGRVLKPGGYLLITWPFNYMLHELPEDYARFSEYGMAELLKNTTMQIEHIVNRGNALIVLAALAEFLVLGALHMGTRLPLLGFVFMLLRRGTSLIAFEIPYRLCLALGSPHQKRHSSLREDMKRGLGHLRLWTLGFCATVRKSDAKADAN
jgi:SAM-dependent methyltransferase